MAYPIIQVSGQVPTQLEQLGTKSKFWFYDEDGNLTLFKIGRPGTGENWAEKVCSEICALLDLPHAQYDLAECNGRKGVISTSFVPRHSRLVLGNELIAGFNKGYQKASQYKARQHTLRLVMAVVGSPNVKFPLNWLAPESFVDSSEVFVGYLMLDALVGNQDRHHENWGVVFDVVKNVIYFAPTYDHASSLGRNETDQKRIECLNTKDRGMTVEAYVARAQSALYLSLSSQSPLKTIEAFSEASKHRPEAFSHWISKLATISDNDFMKILNNIPDSEISEPSRQFAFKMLQINKQRILSLVI